MSLFASLTTAVSGLNAQSAAIGNISDNVANAQTVGFKEIGTSFQNLVTDSTQNFNEPGGVIATPVYENSLAGSLVSASSSTDLAISGQGFFQVKSPPSTTAGTTTGSAFSTANYYTRRGDFSMNDQGYLVNGAGYYLEGYTVNPQTNVVNNASGATQPVQVTQLLDNPVQTSLVTLAANLPSSYAVYGSANYTSPAPVSVQVYDALGNTHEATVQFDHTSASPSTWNAQITLAGAINSTTGAAATDSISLVFGDGSSSVATLSGGASSSTTVPPAGTLAYISSGSSLPASANPPANADTATISAAGTNGGTATVGFNYNMGTVANPVNLPITFNFGEYGEDTGLTQFADSEVNVSSINQNGIPRGSFQSLSIDNNGNVAINYSNGQSLTYFQIPIAQFNAPDQLQRLDGSAFTATQTSGAAQLSAANSNGAGSISSSTLEQSNVDIAAEFTKLITAQNVYSANSKVITTDNQLLQTIINVIQ